MKIETKKVIDLSDWNDFVKETYGRPYNFQQQDDCKDRGLHELTVPNEEEYDFEEIEVKEEVNGPEMGVSFEAWLKRDPAALIPNEDDWGTELWWERNFYPNVQMVANDLYKKGLLESGEYIIKIDW